METIKDIYRNWLFDLVNLHSPPNWFMYLALILWRKEFYWTVPNDDNRAEDGKKLREAFLQDVIVFKDEAEALDGPCTMLEFLIALAERCEYEMLEPSDVNQTSKWFWEMLSNLGLDKFTDEDFARLDGEIEIGRILDTVLERTYKGDGYGGLFPLKKARKNQRKVEIWYQMNAYIIEKYYNDL